MTRKAARGRPVEKKPEIAEAVGSEVARGGGSKAARGGGGCLKTTELRDGSEEDEAETGKGLRDEAVDRNRNTGKKVEAVVEKPSMAGIFEESDGGDCEASSPAAVLMSEKNQAGAQKDGLVSNLTEKSVAWSLICEASSR